MKIIEYSIASGYNYLDVITQVNHRIESGFQPLGQIQVVAVITGSHHNFRYTQTMVKYE